MGFVEKLTPARIWQALRTDRHRRRLLVAWMTFAVMELVLTVAGLTPVPLSAGFLELAGVTALGAIHAALAADDWRGSVAWPCLLGTSVIVCRMSAEIVQLNYRAVNAMLPFAWLGILIIASLVARLLDRVLWRRLPAVLLSILGPLLLHLALLGSHQLSQPLRPMPEPSSDGPPIVIVTVDTLRSDAATEMESVRMLGLRGATWARATAPSSWTWPSIVTLWSGVPAETHGSGRVPEVRYRVERWGDDLPWLPSALRDAGYVSAAFVTNPVVRMMGLESFFDRYKHGGVAGIPLMLMGHWKSSVDAGDARKVVDAAIGWLDDAPSRGYLLWVHLMEPHLPYRHAEGRRYDFNYMRKAKMGAFFVGEDEREDVQRAYLDEVAYADTQLVRLIEALESRGHFDDDGVVVLTSDHGEEFWEHNGFEHGHSHHGEVIDIPLVLVAPGLAPGERHDVAALEDVAPTLAAVAGVSWEGLDLREAIPEGRVAHAFGNLYFRPMRSARMGTTRVIVDGDEIRAYDLAADPQEREPRITSPAELQALAESRPVSDGADGEQFDLDAQALRALGYVH